MIKNILIAVLIVTNLIALAFGIVTYNEAKSRTARAAFENYLKDRPEVAEVKDTSKLTNQPYFNGANNGDLMFIYKSLKLAILYRESTNQIINIGPVEN